MKPIKEEKDMLKRLQNAKDNMVEFANTQQISLNSLMGETLETIFILLDKEIADIEIIRQFYEDKKCKYQLKKIIKPSYLIELLIV